MATRCPAAAPRRGSCYGRITPWAALLAFGLYAAGLCLVKGLNQTNMDNRFAFGLWIFLDLTVIALGAGAFFTGFLLYILKLDELRAVINSAVVIGLVCYSGAVCVLMVDVGQPLRAWFTFLVPQRSTSIAHRGDLLPSVATWLCWPSSTCCDPAEETASYARCLHFWSSSSSCTN